MPKLILDAILMDLFWADQPEHALRAALSFNCYLRPGEASNLQLSDVTVPIRARAGPYRYVGIILAPTERERPTKTGNFDDTLLLDNLVAYPWVSKLLLAARRSSRPLETALFERTYENFAAALVQSCSRLGISEPFHPYQLRHGGAAHDLLFAIRDRESVKARGRWQTETSLRRYGKVGKVQKRLEDIPSTVIDFAHKCEPWLRSVALGQRKPLSPLVAAR